MRDIDAMEAHFDRIIESCPHYWRAWSERTGLSLNQLRMSPRILARREQHGDVGATASLDQLEAGMAEATDGVFALMRQWQHV